MSDYQFLQNKKTKESENELNLPPPLFTRHDQPYDYKFRENPGATTVEIKQVDGSIQIQKKIKHQTTKYVFTSVTYESKEVPNEPPSQYKSTQNTKKLQDVVKV